MAWYHASVLANSGSTSWMTPRNPWTRCLTIWPRANFASRTCFTPTSATFLRATGPATACKRFAPGGDVPDGAHARDHVAAVRVAADHTQSRTDRGDPQSLLLEFSGDFLDATQRGVSMNEHRMNEHRQADHAVP